MKLKAKWIWRKQRDYRAYNKTIVARRTFKAGALKRAVLYITADSFYRLYINNVWVNDGPCRSWPKHYRYDTLDVMPYLTKGENEIKVIARYYGVGDFHRVPQQAGLLVQLDMTGCHGVKRTVISDGRWQTAQAKAWRSDTPKISAQMEPAEYYDARLETSVRFEPAAVLFAAHEGPWQHLKPNDVALMTRKPMYLKSFTGAQAVTAKGLNFCIPTARLLFPDAIEANFNISPASGYATIIRVRRKTKITLHTEGVKATIDGKYNAREVDSYAFEGDYNLAPGEHLFVAFANDWPFPNFKEKVVRFVGEPAVTLVNPVDPKDENPWTFIAFKEFALFRGDRLWLDHLQEDAPLCTAIEEYKQLTERLLKTIRNQQGLLREAGDRLRSIPSSKMFVEDSYWQFQRRNAVCGAEDNVLNPGGLMYDNAAATVVMPGPNGDIELAYDLGEQTCGYYAFELTAAAGVIVDINSIEYRTEDGQLQHVQFNRNGMRYLTRKGRNSFVSLKRRAGRYLYITLRNQTSPVTIHNVRVIESTYPVESVGRFICSDERLNRIWDISERTLKLCMEDVFTDCPLYEQTLWVGDARNEALFAYGVFGATDLSRQCIRLAAESLDESPLVGSQVPSSWDPLIPAWSFLWGISVWDYYWYTGDKAFVRRMWPAVMKNLKGAETLIDPQGLFNAPFWNLFDWAGIDHSHRVVLHSSMFLVGAIDAAIQCAGAIDRQEDVRWLSATRRRLTSAINRCWDRRKGAYPDSIHSDGKPSTSVSQHTSFLSLLYDIVEKRHRSKAIENTLRPPQGMVTVGSPFAVMYLFEALEKIGAEDHIVESIYRYYLPMLKAGATTVWETFAAGNGPFPTRSHCHGWSAAPLYFLSRTVLGVKQVSPGGAAYMISPRLNGLDFANGTVLTPHGALDVSWQVSSGTLFCNYTSPKHTQVRFVRNETHTGLKTEIRGTTR